MNERVFECVKEDIRTNTHTKAHTHNKLLNTRTHAHTNGRSHKHARRHSHTQPHTYIHTNTHTSLASKTNSSTYSHARVPGSTTNANRLCIRARQHLPRQLETKRPCIHPGSDSRRPFVAHLLIHYHLQLLSHPRLKLISTTER